MIKRMIYLYLGFTENQIPRRDICEKRKSGRKSFGRFSRITHSGVLRLDDIASSSKIPVVPVQDWISNHSGIWCISGVVLVYDVRGTLTGNRTRLTPLPPPNRLHNQVTDT